MRKALAIAAGVVLLAAANWVIYGREQLLAEGRVVLLELAPVDPRSLMQGDYMALRFKAANDAFGRGPPTDGDDGRIVVRVDSRGVGEYLRRDDGSPLAADELALRYRVRDGRVKFATNAFFFQEGGGRDYQAARFGEFRVATSGASRGNLILTGVRGKDLEPLGKRPTPAR